MFHGESDGRLVAWDLNGNEVWSFQTAPGANAPADTPTEVAGEQYVAILAGGNRGFQMSAPGDSLWAFKIWRDVPPAPAPPEPPTVEPMRTGGRGGAGDPALTILRPSNGLRITCATTGCFTSPIWPAGRPAARRGQRHHNLREDHCHEEHRPSGQVLLGSGNGRRQERQVGEVAERNEREQPKPSPIDVPTEDSIEEFDDERGERRGRVQTQAQLRRGQSGPEHDVVGMRGQIEDQVRHDAEADRAPQRRPTESFLDDQPRQGRGADAVATECE